MKPIILSSLLLASCSAMNLDMDIAKDTVIQVKVDKEALSQGQSVSVTIDVEKE